MREFGDNVDIFDIPVPDNVQQLCWGMQKITAKLMGKVVEIRIDATCV